jgi:heme ABC exporter ATP-binding subunit CcmA
VITVTGVDKRYGPRRVLRDVSFTVPAGETLLVTGPNGSGKTTLLRILAGLQAPTKGRVEIAVGRARLGYLGHEPMLYRELTALENLDLFGRLYRVPERRERIGMLLERLGLWEARAERVSKYSRGMTQRLALCRVLLHDPALLVLDEPHTALDADGGALLDAELAELARTRTLVVATHEPARVEPIATQQLAMGLGGVAAA